MKTKLNQHFSSLQFGEVQTYKHVVIIPLLGGENGGPLYVTLDQALAERKLAVTELTESGSVPELKVINTSDQLVLLLDGEEVVGAKQNRVLNTSILIPARAEVAIPVSCTEHGRWAYTSKEFIGSNAFLAHKIRFSKAGSVTKSLESSAQFQSDQGEVWDHIASLHAKAGFHSPTGAMADLFKAREDELGHCLEAFPLVPGQTGLLVLIDGEVAGLDTVSRSHAYARLHARLVRSYVLDELLGLEKRSTVNCQPTAAPADPLAQAKAFLEQVQACEVKPFPSVGCGQDCRLSGPKMIGTALVHQETVVHSSLFRGDPAEQGSSVAPFQRRRSIIG